MVDTLRGRGIFGWAVTVAFYSAVHYTRGYLASVHGLKVVRHDDMKKLWPVYSDLAAIRSSYDLLKEQSHAHRYYLKKFTDTGVTDLQKHLAKVKAHLEPLAIKGPLIAQPPFKLVK